MSDKKEVRKIETPKKIGRPTNNPKSTERITVRLDNECSSILEEYCKKENIEKSEGIRRGIKLLKNK
ncbi:hypothetical protein P7A83_15100 [Clostridium perfringens]|nr:hypothetical protein [Clostridium perfringens]